MVCTKISTNNNQIADWLQIALWAGQDKRLLPFTTATVISNYQRVVMQCRRRLS